ncbi:zinc ribbon domain-containing protein [bacterium]|nr:zinc ribbon domain-containing protein [bacterium]
MPIYEFNCPSCRKPFQKLLPSMSWKGVVCPACGSDKVEKKLSRFAVVGGEDSGDSDFGSGDSDADGDAACSGDPSDCSRCDLDD